MSSAAEQLTSVPFEAYLATLVDDPHAVKAEWVGGRVFVMSGGSERHDLASGLLYELVAGPARARGCRPFVFNRMIKTDHAAHYPDVLVVCGPAGNRNYETDAQLVVEVSSPSTRGTDRREKALVYSQLPGLQVYALLDPDNPVIEVATPAPDGGLSWRRYGPGDVVFLGDATLVVDDFHETLDRTATT